MGIVSVIMCVTVFGLSLGKPAYFLSIISLFNMVLNGKSLYMMYKYSLDKEILLKRRWTLLNIVTTIVAIILFIILITK